MTDNPKPHEDFVYKVDKMTYIVTPVYRDKPDKTVHEILLDLMKKDVEKC